MPESSETYLLLYKYVDNMAERRVAHREAHLAHLAHLIAEREAGRLLLGGAYGDPVTGGVIGFKGVTREHVESWVATDPYNLAALVAAHEIHPWKLV